MAAELYDRDFYEWTQRNAELLRAGRIAGADLEHIAGEIEDLGKSDRRELENRLDVLIMHLLEFQAQAGRRSRSWQSTIAGQRARIERLLRQSPSLRRCLKQMVQAVYPDAVRRAAIETGVPREQFPAACPFTITQLLDPDYLPRNAVR